MRVNEASRIIAKLEQYTDDPKSQANNVKKLTGSNYILLRVGDWRIIMDDQGDVLEILKITSRGSAYN